jgi:HEAT repeat protein
MLVVALSTGMCAWGAELPSLEGCVARDMENCASCAGLADRVAKSPALVAELAGKPGELEQSCAVYWLGRSGSQPSVLDQLVQSTHPSVRRAAIELAGVTGLSQSAWRVLHFCKDAVQRGDEEMALVCIRSLGLLGDESAVPFLLEVVRQPGQRILRVAIRALGSFHSDQVVDELARIATDPGSSESARGEALSALGATSHPRGAELILPMLKSKDETLRRQAIIALGKARHPKAAEALVAAVDRVSTRDLAIEALCTMQTPEAAEILFKLWGRKSLEAEARNRALIGAVSLGNVKGLRPLAKLLGSLTGESLRLAIQSLGNLGSKDALKPLVSLVKDGCTQYCDDILWAVRRCSGESVGSLEEAVERWGK